MGEEQEAPEVQLRRAIGRVAPDARIELRLTQAEVADALGMAPEVYGRIKRGAFTPSVVTLVNVATVLRITPEQLLGWSARQQKTRSPERDRILALLDRTAASSLKRVEAVLEALLSPDPKKK